MNEPMIWANNLLSESARDRLVSSVGIERLILQDVVLDWPEPERDPRTREAAILFGQPHPDDLIASKNLKWVQISTAGIDRYDNEIVRGALAASGALMSTSSDVYFDACAQHVVALVLADCRQLYFAQAMQTKHRYWEQHEVRRRSRRLNSQEVLIVGYGNIGHRVAELLKPFGPRIKSYRRSQIVDDITETVPSGAICDALGTADHVINILPDSVHTRNFFDAKRFHYFKSGARYYSVGRGTTTDHNALAKALYSFRISAAYLDVTEPEPLPPDHALRINPNCFITPHSGSGHVDEGVRLVEHFVANLERFKQNRPLRNLVL